MSNLKKYFSRIILTASLFFVFSSPAHAMIIEFNFNALSDGANNTTVKNHMRSILNVLKPGSTVNVTGSKAEKNYIGDGYVVGPVSGNTVTPYTLGNTDGGVFHGTPWDAYLINSGSDRITMTFSFPIYYVSFDYEIFPDGTCPKASKNCTEETSNWPDFSFKADGVLQFRTLGIDPNVSGPYQHSPKSGVVKNEKAPQFLGLSGEFYFSSGVTKLEFIDWPRLIGIDNLKIGDEPPPTPSIPEPSSVALMAMGLAGMLFYRRRFASRS